MVNIHRASARKRRGCDTEKSPPEHPGSASIQLVQIPLSSETISLISTDVVNAAGPMDRAGGSPAMARKLKFVGSLRQQASGASSRLTERHYSR